MLIARLSSEHMDSIFDILRQDSIRGYNGKYAETELPWITHFIYDPNCFCMGAFDDDNLLISVLIAERLTFGGCIPWYLATMPERQGYGFGSRLLSEFENEAKLLGVEWIFMNGTNNSLDFYSKRGYITSEYSNVYEHVKNL